MPIADFLIVVYWWGILLVIAVLSYPIAFILSSKLDDRGWGISKYLGLAVLTYWIWITGSLHVLPFGNTTIWIGIFLLAYISYSIFKQKRGEFSRFLKTNWRLLVFEEITFGLLLYLWSWIRGHQPDINGLEKFMDFGFINSILRTDFFPPADMWLAGKTINYYYFGHLAVALVTKLSGISSSITYNLMIATILAFAFVTTFSLAKSLFSNLFLDNRGVVFRFSTYMAGFTSALILNFGGNLHTVYKIITQGTETYWYPDATRYIPFTIHEFPQYSYVVSDLHGHVSDIPFVLTTISLWFVLYLDLNKRFRSAKLPINIARMIIIGLLIAIMYMTNALDAIIYFGLFLFMMSLTIIRCYSFDFNNLDKWFPIPVIGFSALLFSLPFHLKFSPFAKGIDLVRAHSSITQLLILWGFFLIVAIACSIFVLIQRKRGLFAKAIFDKFGETFIISLVCISIFLVLIPEVVYIKDIYIADYHRANTMFKLVYQTFILMSLVTGPIFVSSFLLINTVKGKRFRIGLMGILLMLGIGIGCVLIYPYFAVRSYYNRLQNYVGLNGLSWMAERYPNDYAALLWLNKTVAKQAVILEAVGESYTDYARISANTGLSTVLGWRVHEWLWRGSFDEAGLRTGDVTTIYTSSDKTQVCSLINKYSLNYIFVGDLEYEQYPYLTLQTINSIGGLVFSQGNSQVFAVNKVCQ